MLTKGQLLNRADQLIMITNNNQKKSDKNKKTYGRKNSTRRYMKESFFLIKVS